MAAKPRLGLLQMWALLRSEAVSAGLVHRRSGRVDYSRHQRGQTGVELILREVAVSVPLDRLEA